MAQCAGPNQAAFSTLIDRHDGTYELIMRPQEPGLHKLTITYGSEPVPGLSFVHSTCFGIIRPQLCVCLLVTSLSHAKMAEQIEMPFGICVLVGPKDHYYMWPRSPSERVTFGEKYLHMYRLARSRYSQPYVQECRSDAAFGYQYCNIAVTVCSSTCFLCTVILSWAKIVWSV